MSHPIDDLFRRGLEDAKYKGHDASWPEAKELLGLQETKRRRFLWLWFFLALGMAGAYFAWYNLGQNDPADDNHLYAENKTVEVISGDNRSPSIEELNKGEVAQNNSIRPDKNTTESTSILDEEDNSKIQKLEKEKSSEPTLSTTAEDKKLATNSPERQENTTEKPHKPMMDKGQPSISNDEIRGNAPSQQKPAGTGGLAVTASEKRNFNTAENETFHQQTTELLPASEISSIQSLSWLLDLDRNPPELMKKVELDGGEKGSSLNPTGSFYLSYGGLSDRLEGGMLLTTALPDYWSLDVGLGLAHQNGLDGTNPEESLNRQSAQLNYNEYSYTTLTIPLLLQKSMGHNVFSIGFSLDRIISLNGFLSESRVVPIQVDADLDFSGIPVTLDNPEMVSDPVGYQLRDVDDAQKWHTMLQAYYGRSIEKLGVLSLGITYRPSSLQIVPNTIDNQVLNLDPSITKYDVRLRWKYTF